MRIAHFSDPHLFNPQLTKLNLFLQQFTFSDLFNKRLIGAINFWFSRRQKHSPDLFRSLCQDLNEIRPDHIVITGDLTNLSLVCEFEYVKQMLDLLHFPSSAITIIPGNHDVYVKAAKGSFENYFQSYFRKLNNEEQESYSSQTSVFPWVQDLGEVVFIATTSAKPTLPFLAMGSLGAKQREILKQKLLAFQGKFRILLIHHAPIVYRHDFMRGLRDKKELQSLLLETGCELVLHGHEHRDLYAFIQDSFRSIQVIGTGSCTYADPKMDRRARYHIYTITASQLAEVECRVHDPVDNKFIQYRTVSPSLLKFSRKQHNIIDLERILFSRGQL